MQIICLDLEGVLIPEVWQGVAARTGIDTFKLTTRDIKDYDELMQLRLRALDEHGIRMADVRSVIGELEPLDGARAFLDELRSTYQVAIISDTFYEFARSFMVQLGEPFLLCHRLTIDSSDRITGYRLRQPDPKRASVRAFHELRYQVVAAGDSYNDVSMLDEADAGVFFRAPERVLADFPQFPLVQTYAELRAAIDAAVADMAALAPA